MCSIIYIGSTPPAWFDCIVYPSTIIEWLSFSLNVELRWFKCTNKRAKECTFFHLPLSVFVLLWTPVRGTTFHCLHWNWKWESASPNIIEWCRRWWAHAMMMMMMCCWVYANLNPLAYPFVVFYLSVCLVKSIAAAALSSFLMTCPAATTISRIVFLVLCGLFCLFLFFISDFIFFTTFYSLFFHSPFLQTLDIRPHYRHITIGIQWRTGCGCTH